MNRNLFAVLGAFLMLLFSPYALGAKTDIVVLKNGDKITGEVKSLLRGKLEFSTDSMGTVSIEWLDIQTVISDTSQSVELANGQRFFGPLSKSENSEMVAVETEQGTVGLGIMDVIAMYPVEAGFWHRFDIRASLGFSWDKASSVGKYNVGLDTEWRDPNHLTRGGFSSEVTTLKGADDTRRANANVNHMRFRPNKRFTSYFANIESNDELGIDLRTLVGLGYGWIPVRSNHNWLLFSAGVDINHEIPNEGEAETNLEGVGMFAYEYFRYSEPERNFKTELMVFPSITDPGRWRAEFNTDLDIEFVKDFFWVFSIFASYDSDPITDDEDTSNSDYGFMSSVAYEW